MAVSIFGTDLISHEFEEIVRQGPRDFRGAGDILIFALSQLSKVIVYRLRDTHIIRPVVAAGMPKLA